MVPGAGLEPARLAAGDFESPTSTNFITRAGAKALVQLFIIAEETFCCHFEYRYHCRLYDI
jgi:hypothetical protein